MPGPVPKRSAERIRRNKDAVPTDTVEMPPLEDGWAPPDEGWHPIATMWYESLQASGQAAFYEPSDRATAYVLAENLSRELSPQFVGMGTVWNREAGEMETRPMKMRIPMKGASLGALLKGMTALLVTEGDRRRLRLEVEREASAGPTPSGVASLAERRAAQAERLRAGR